MVKPTNQLRLDQIVEAAVRRFAHFGIAKTTLTEVAEDLALSKQALAYYFPDKQSLVNAVIEKLSDDYSRQLAAEIAGSSTVEAALLKLTDVKADYFERYYMFATQAEHFHNARQESYQTWRMHLAHRESGLLTNLFEKGIRQGELKAVDAHKTAELLLETLYAFSKCMKEGVAVPDPQAFRELLMKQREVIKLFYQGLKAETWIN